MPNSFNLLFFLSNNFFNISFLSSINPKCSFLWQLGHTETIFAGISKLYEKSAPADLFGQSAGVIRTVLK